jgi:hypothetical protein
MGESFARVDARVVPVPNALTGEGSANTVYGRGAAALRRVDAGSQFEPLRGGCGIHGGGVERPRIWEDLRLATSAYWARFQGSPG